MIPRKPVSRVLYALATTRPALLLVLFLPFASGCPANNAAPDCGAAPVLDGACGPVCPDMPVHEGEVCGFPVGMPCPSTFAQQCDGTFDRLYCRCDGAHWVCQFPVCGDGGTDAGRDAAMDVVTDATGDATGGG